MDGQSLNLLFHKECRNEEGSSKFNLKINFLENFTFLHKELSDMYSKRKEIMESFNFNKQKSYIMLAFRSSIDYYR